MRLCKSVRWGLLVIPLAVALSVRGDPSDGAGSSLPIQFLPLDFEARVLHGPGAGLYLAGNLRLGFAGSDGGLVGELTLPDGSTAAALGWVRGRQGGPYEIILCFDIGGDRVDAVGSVTLDPAGLPEAVGRFIEPVGGGEGEWAFTPTLQDSDFGVDGLQRYGATDLNWQNNGPGY